MIDIKTAQKHAIPTIKSGATQQTDQQKLIEKLKTLLPQVINSDNLLDVNALKDVVDIASSNDNNQGYELTFAGKSLARHLADTPTDYELKVENKQSKDFDNTSNVVIRGDNLEVLKVLYQNYYSKIKMIYIDPPYNTQNENFVYKDNFKLKDAELIERFGMDEDTQNFLHNVYGTRSHSGWLCFMYPRLKLARELLRDDGVIFISIDDNEQANLKILCDEIFGEGNLVDSIVWNNKYTLQNDAKYTCSQYENILFYAKHKNDFSIGKKNRTEYQNKSYKNPDNDPKGAWKATPLHAKSGTNTENSVYSVTFSNGVSWSVPSGRYARFSKKKLLKLEKENELYFNKNGGVDKKTYLKIVEKKGVVFSNLWDYKDTGHTHGNNEELADLVGKGIFDNPKGTKLIRQITKVANIQNNDIILDFFAGSGTTGDAVMQLNAEDGGNRKFILVQWDEVINPKKSSEAYKFCTENNLPPVISSICIERLNRAGEKIKGEKIKDEKIKNDLTEDNNKNNDKKPCPDIGYKVYSLNKKPMVVEKNEAFQLKSDRTTLDTLANMLSATCKTLDIAIETIKENAIYKADHEVYIISQVILADLEKIDNIDSLKINLDGWANIDLEHFLNLKESFKNNLTVVY